MPEADYAEDGIHGMTYFSCPIPGDPSQGNANSSPSSSSAVVGLTYLDGGGTAENMPIVINMLLNKPGILMAVIRSTLVVLCRIALLLLPMDRILRGSRGALLLVTTIKSRGTLRLASADAEEHPLIDPGYLSHREDQQAVCACWHKFRQAKRETATGKAVFGAEILPGKRSVFTFIGATVLIKAAFLMFIMFVVFNASTLQDVGTETRIESEIGATVVAFDWGDYRKAISYRQERCVRKCCVRSEGLVPCSYYKIMFQTVLTTKLNFYFVAHCATTAVLLGTITAMTMRAS